MNPPATPSPRSRTIVWILVGLATIALVLPFGRGCGGGSFTFSSDPQLKATLLPEPTTPFVEGSLDEVRLSTYFELNGDPVQPAAIEIVQTGGPTVPLSAVTAAQTATVDVRLLDVSTPTELAFRVTATHLGLTAQGEARVTVEPAPALITSLRATPDVVLEGASASVTLEATFSTTPRGGKSWRQTGGRRAGLKDGGARATVDVSKIQVATDVVLEFELSAVRAPGWPAETATVSVIVRPSDVTSALGAHVQIGGQSLAAATFTDEGGRWALFNTANRLRATRVGTTQSEVHSLHLPGLIRDLDVVGGEGGEPRRALVAMGDEGIAVVDLTDVSAMRLLSTVAVGSLLTNVPVTDGGGTISTITTIQSTRAPITALETDGTNVWIADEGYGVHRTALSNLLSETGPVRNEQGTLKIDAETPTVQYAGENPWGGPKALLLHNGRLFVAMGHLGLGILDPSSLGVLGRYNLYTDASVTEDYYRNMDVAEQVQADATGLFLDPVTGMPDYRQAAFEISQVWRDGVVAPTPWADFDRQGKYYYDARSVDVQDRADGRAIAFVAYGLAGVVAVDVTGYDRAVVGERAAVLPWLGYLPAVPAHGPEQEIEHPSSSLYPTYGSHRLAEAGAVGVRVAGERLIYTDHFGGLMATSNDPETWHGPAAPYDNDTVPPLGNFVPREEFVTSFDMRLADPTDHESLPTFMTQAPLLLATGELYGHGNALLLVPGLDVDAPGGVDVLLCAGAGGFVFVDLTLAGAAPESTVLFSVPAHFPTTDEIGARPDGTPGEAINIGHTDGVATSADYLYVADGPHGVSAWRITGDDGEPTAAVHLVANALQAEDPVLLGDATIYPTPHAHGVVVDPAAGIAYVPCRTAGLRRVDVGRVERGEARRGAPLLLAPTRADVFKHKLEETHEDGDDADEGEGGPPLGLTSQDHAYDVEVRGPLAYVADGNNGLTIYDLTRDPSDPLSGFVHGNLGGGAKTKPVLGRATGIVLWDDASSGRTYAILACGPRGIGVVDVTTPSQPTLVKVFEPIKLELELEEGSEEPSVHVGAADGRAADVVIAGAHAYVSYDSFGVVCYAVADLIAPAPPGVDPSELWTPKGGPDGADHRPVARSEFRLSEVPEYAEHGGGALNVATVDAGGRLTVWVAYGQGGLVRLDWSDPQAPVFGQLVPTAGDCTSVSIRHGWLYVADHDGGLAIFR